jgi:integrase
MANDDRNILERRGRLELSKYWPDGTRFRRPFPNRTLARQMRARIDAAIADGTWWELKHKLSLERKDMPAPAPPTPKPLTVRDYAPAFLAEMQRRNRRPDFHRIQVNNILPVLGEVPLKDIGRAEALRYRASRPDHLERCTLNRGVAVLRSMLSCAIEEGLIPGPNPLFGFKDYKEAKRDLYIMSIPEERRFVATLLDIDLAVGVYAGFMGETAIRTEETLRLYWPMANLETRIVTVPAGIAKTNETRHIHMSDFCHDLLGMLPRVTDYPEIFIRTSTLKPVKETRGAFLKARERTGLAVYPESFRHFRITQWMSQGIDPRSVQELAGHQDIHTTMRYAHYAPGHASRRILEVQRNESETLRQLVLAFESGVGPKQDQSVAELERLFAMESAK